jgi:hypothetical protein
VELRRSWSQRGRDQADAYMHRTPRQSADAAKNVPALSMPRRGLVFIRRREVTGGADVHALPWQKPHGRQGR